MNEYTFVSLLGPSLIEMIEYKCSIGYQRSTYENPLKNFDHFAKENFPLEENLTRDLAMGWLTRRENEGINAFYHRIYLMRIFGKYLKTIGKTAYIVPDHFGKSSKNFMPYIYSDNELNELFYMIDTLSSELKSPFQTQVFPVLFRLTYTCGLRPNESRLLMRENINEHTGELRIVKTKQHKERLIVMSDDMKSYMKKYLSIRDAYFCDNPFVFPRIDGKSYTSRQVQAFLMKCWTAVKSDLDPDLIPAVRTYDFRHRFATEVLTRWMEQDMDIPNMLPYLKMYMGHVSFSSTVYYVHLLPERIVHSSNIDWKAFYDIVPEVELWEE